MPSLPPQESQSYPWAAPVTPVRPRGWYDPLYRLMLAYNGYAVYPAFYGQFFGPYVQRDYWWMPEFDAAIGKIAGGRPWGYEMALGFLTRYGDVYNYLHSLGYFSYPYYWARMWTLHYDDARPQKWFVCEATIQGPNRVKDLSTGTWWTIGLFPYVDNLLLLPALAISDHVYPPISFPGDPDIG